MLINWPCGIGMLATTTPAKKTLLALRQAEWDAGNYVPKKSPLLEIDEQLAKLGYEDDEWEEDWGRGGDGEHGGGDVETNLSGSISTHSMSSLPIEGRDDPGECDFWQEQGFGPIAVGSSKRSSGERKTSEGMGSEKDRGPRRARTGLRASFFPVRNRAVYVAPDDDDLSDDGSAGSGGSRDSLERRRASKEGLIAKQLMAYQKACGLARCVGAIKSAVLHCIISFDVSM